MKLLLLLPFVVTGAFAQTSVPQGYNSDMDTAHCYAWGGDRATNSFGYCSAAPPLKPETLVIEKIVIEERPVPVPGPERIILKEVPRKKVRE